MWTVRPSERDPGTGGAGVAAHAHAHCRGNTDRCHVAWVGDRSTPSIAHWCLGFTMTSRYGLREYNAVHLLIFAHRRGSAFPILVAMPSGYGRSKRRSLRVSRRPYRRRAIVSVGYLADASNGSDLSVETSMATGSSQSRAQRDVRHAPAPTYRRPLPTAHQGPCRRWQRLW